jgi:hypothetical protein
MVFRRPGICLAIGIVEPNRGFGLRLEVERFQVRRFSLDFGGPNFGPIVAAQQAWQSPRVRLMAVRTDDPNEAFGQFFASMDLPVRRFSPLAAWVSEPLYCTWLDQVFEAEANMPVALNDQPSDPGWDLCTSVMTEGLVRRAVETIRIERLPIKTILLDVGWSKAIGQWEVDLRKFPNMRGLVDDLHAQGFRVVVWWHWGELEDIAEVDSRFLMGHGWRNRHGRRAFDYSARATQEEYLPAMFRSLFSEAPGCFNFDGVKTDFLADKIHPESPIENENWRGEENYFLRVSELFYNEMRRHKVDAAHIGASAHPWLGPFIDANRTYDVHSSDPYEHFARAEMLGCACPDVPVVFDFHTCLDNLDLYFRLAKELGSGVQIGNVLSVRKDPSSRPEIPPSSYFEQLRAGLELLG